jgi:hypothetical protein
MTSVTPALANAVAAGPAAHERRHHAPRRERPGKMSPGKPAAPVTRHALFGDDVTVNQTA